jgi:hypothetical protein
METIGSVFLATAIKRLSYYKDLGDKTFAQLQEPDFYYQPNEASNSIAVIIQHMNGNMLSRWINFLTEDGEKEWRNRDVEFETHTYTKDQLLQIWQKGWQCVLDAWSALEEADLLKTVSIRAERLSVIDAINRQLAHYPYHVGQIVYLGREIKNSQWQNLSIPKGDSAVYNRQLRDRQ